MDLTRLLREWTITNNVTQTSVTKLLHILAVFHPFLPLDCRTLLKADSIVKHRESFSEGEFCYVGIQQALCATVSTVPDSETELNLLFNIDGMPLHKSNNLQFWPILMRVKNNIESLPSVVAIFMGNSKPDLSHFLKAFVEDLSKIVCEGIQLNDRHFQVKIAAFICDSPARAFIKGTKYHNSYHGCDFCVQEGSFDGRLIFDEMEAAERTDADFEQYEDHIRENSPLTQVPGIKMITHFPLDYMHCLLLGVTRKILLLWMSGPLHSRLSSARMKSISDSFVALRPYFSSEFSRKPRSIMLLRLWKAVEFRSFLLYAAPICLAENLETNFYKHFLLLFISVRLLCCKNSYLKYSAFCDRLLKTFVLQCENLYGSSSLTYNVHSLLHITQHSQNHGPLDQYSAFPFESYLGQLKSN